MIILNSVCILQSESVSFLHRLAPTAMQNMQDCLHLHSKKREMRDECKMTCQANRLRVCNSFNTCVYTR